MGGGLSFNQIVMLVLGGIAAFFAALAGYRGKKLFKSQTQLLEDQQANALAPLEQAAEQAVAEAEKAKEDYDASK